MVKMSNFMVCVSDHTHTRTQKACMKPGPCEHLQGQCSDLSVLVVCEVVMSPSSQSAWCKGGVPTYATGLETPGPTQLPRYKPTTFLAGSAGRSWKGSQQSSPL